MLQVNRVLNTMLRLPLTPIRDWTISLIVVVLMADEMLLLFGVVLDGFQQQRQL